VVVVAGISERSHAAEAWLRTGDSIGVGVFEFI